MNPRPWTLVLPYYENPGMLLMQLQHLEQWSPESRECLRLIVVDDGSPTKPALPVFQEWGWDKDPLPFRFQLYRIGVDVRWNWIACRNLAMAKAETEWRLMTDIDHLVPEQTADFIANGSIKARRIYRFARKDWPALTDYKPHPNSWLMTGAMFDKVGGYDERFSGYYGTDGMFRDRCIAAAEQVMMIAQPLLRVAREQVADASTTTYGRKEKQDHEGVRRIRADIAQSGKLTPLRGSFPWEQLI